MMAEVTCFAMQHESESSAIALGLRRRDPELLDRLIEQYQHRLLRYLVYQSGSRELAEDLFQETWTRVLERGHQFDGRHEFSAWLFSIARNLTLDYLRRKNPLSLDAYSADERPTHFEPTAPQPSPWEVLARRERSDQLQTALQTIPAEYREAVLLRFQEDLPLNEIAAVTKTKLGTVKSRLYRGINLLVSRLKEFES